MIKLYRMRLFIAINLTEETKRKYVEDFAFIDAISGWSKNDNMIRKKIVKVQ